METSLTLICFRCNHSWLRRSLAKLPSTCPRCCSPYWNRPRKPAGSPHPQPSLTVSDSPRPALTEFQAMRLASDVIGALCGYRKTADYRTIQNDLHLACEVILRALAQPKP
jgi:hypothetical protein